MIEGIDVSSWQGTIDWQAVALSGRVFAFVKASEGIGYLDPNFPVNWKGIREAGMIRGAYHFARPSRNPAKLEAAHFVATLKMVGGLEPGDLVALDLEDPDVDPHAALSPWAMTWLQAVEAVTGCRPLLYSNPSYMQAHNLDTDEMRVYPLWLASWGSVPPDQGEAVWQFSDHETVPGITGPCDGDRAESIEALRAMGKPAPAPKVVIPDMKRVRALLDTAWGIAGGLDGVLSPYGPQLRDVVVGLKEEIGLQPKP